MMDPMNGIVIDALQFAAEKHRNQRRKDAQQSPYVNHLILVTHLLWNEGGVRDPEVLAGGILHDTIEDTETTSEELTARFGERVTKMVLEVTDDKSLPKAERKLRQVKKAGSISHEAKQIKLADKCANLTDLRDHPPHDWPAERLLGYVDWAERVVQATGLSDHGLNLHFNQLADSLRTNLGQVELG
ncbi:HD domain-containing protein [Pontibacter sp. G13]|uniref:HD domain-containing protein n=1 Tax=Pontibacter sp. G13 TaxID=3074898 RepID=UPI00288A5345|nr:HD domain-containing protein [Pontibacter sp. G13]WNJ21478.1 HD domain-containing protein [Pontibacter sp. G13]